MELPVIAKLFDDFLPLFKYSNQGGIYSIFLNFKLSKIFLHANFEDHRLGLFRKLLSLPV